jgi:hypothetical protein
VGCADVRHGLRATIRGPVALHCKTRASQRVFGAKLACWPRAAGCSHAARDVPKRATPERTAGCQRKGLRALQPQAECPSICRNAVSTAATSL